MVSNNLILSKSNRTNQLRICLLVKPLTETTSTESQQITYSCFLCQSIVRMWTVRLTGIEKYRVDAKVSANF